MTLFSKELAMALVPALKAEGHRLLLVMAIGDGDEVDVTVVGDGSQDSPEYLDGLEYAFGKLIEELREHIAFQEPAGNA